MALGRTLRFFGKYYRISQLTRNELAGFCVIGSAVQQELQQICQGPVLIPNAPDTKSIPWAVVVIRHVASGFSVISTVPKYKYIFVIGSGI